MQFGLISHKLDFLTQNIPQSKLHDAYQATFAQLGKDNLVHSELVFIEIIFLLSSQRRWRHLPLFADLMEEYLASSLGIKKSNRQRLIETLAEFAVPVESPQSPKLSEQDYLNWLIATSTLTKNANSLIIATGLGRQLIKRIKYAASIAFREHSSNKEKIFLSELDQKLVATTVRLHQGQREKPWFLESMLIKYQLNQMPEPWEMMASESSHEFIHQLLAFMHGHPQCNCTEITKLLKTLIPGLTDLPKLPKHVQALLRHIAECNLIYSVTDCRSLTPGKSWWALTPNGEHLSVCLFLSQQQDQELSFDTIINLREHAQATYLSSLDGNLPEKVSRQYLQQLGKFKPDGIRMLLKLAKPRIPTGESADYLIAAYSNCQLPWSRKLILEALRELTSLPQVADFIEKIAIFDRAPMVKEEAAYQHLQFLTLPKGCAGEKPRDNPS